MTDQVPQCSTCGLVVDYGRSCYVSGWRLFRDDLSIVTRGRYYFAPPNTPHVPFNHHLGSRNWYDRNWEHVQTLGEDLTHKQTWSAGQLPAAPPLRLHVGTQECIELGSLVSDAMPASDLIDGFPPLCMGPEERLPIWREISSYARCVTQRVWAFIICELYEDNLAGIQNIFNDWIGDVAVITLHAGTDIFPAILTVVAPEWSALVFDGTRNFQQLALQALYSTVGPVSYGGFSTLPLWYQASSRGLQFLQQDGYVVGTPLFTCGHSYGAAAALISAVRIRMAHQNNYIRYLTFGCPKPGDQRLHNLIAECAGLSVRNTGDIVTAVPNDRLQIAAFIPTYGLGFLLKFLHWITTPRSALQYPDGRLELRGDDDLDTETIGSILYDAFHDFNLLPIQSHTIGEYIRRLKLRCPDVNWPINDAVLSDCDQCLPIGWGWWELSGYAQVQPDGYLQLGGVGQLIADGYLRLGGAVQYPANGFLRLGAVAKNPNGFFRLGGPSHMPANGNLRLTRKLHVSPILHLSGQPIHDFPEREFLRLDGRWLPPLCTTARLLERGVTYHGTFNRFEDGAWYKCGPFLTQDTSVTVKIPFGDTADIVTAFYYSFSDDCSDIDFQGTTTWPVECQTYGNFINYIWVIVHVSLGVTKPVVYTIEINTGVCP